MSEVGQVAGCIRGGAGGSGPAGSGDAAGFRGAGGAADSGGSVVLPGVAGRDDSRRLLNRTEARAYLGGIGTTLIWRLEIDGELRAVRIGRRVMYRREDLDRFIERRARRDSRRAV